MPVGIIESILLFPLAVYAVMKYRILPVEGTPYWLFGIVFFLATLNILISLYPEFLGKAKTARMKPLLVWTVVLIVVGGISWTAMKDRSRVAPVYNVHDIILQQEAAMRYLVVGKNPYKETYFGTPVEEFDYAELGNEDAVNPALYHFVMPPWYLLFPFAFYFPANRILGFFDGRMPLLFLLFGLLIVMYRWMKRRELGLLAIVLISLVPPAFDYFIEGRSDMFVLFWLVSSVVVLEKRRPVIASVLFVIALLSKQTAWFALPFYGTYLWVQEGRKLKNLVLAAGAVIVVLAVVLGPFLAWDARAFIDSTIHYLNGSTSYGYPVSGYGLGMLLYETGVIRDIHAYYPFIYWQAAVGIPVLFLALRFFLRRPNSSRFFIGYALTLLSVWYTSRYFNNSHIAFIGTIFLIGAFKHVDEKSEYE